MKKGCDQMRQKKMKKIRKSRRKRKQDMRIMRVVFPYECPLDTIRNLKLENGDMVKGHKRERQQNHKRDQLQQ